LRKGNTRNFVYHRSCPTENVRRRIPEFQLDFNVLIDVTFPLLRPRMQNAAATVVNDVNIEALTARRIGTTRQVDRLSFPSPSLAPTVHPRKTHLGYRRRMISGDAARRAVRITG